MANGPGQYDALCTQIRKLAKADGAILIILNGEYGNGFSSQASPVITTSLPGMLESMADEIFEDNLNNSQLRDVWWVGLSEQDRTYWLACAGSTRPADAWAFWLKRLNKRI